MWNSLVWNSLLWNSDVVRCHGDYVDDKHKGYMLFYFRRQITEINIYY